MTLYTLDDLDLGALRGRRVLVRVDFNVPLQDGKVLDATRLEESLPTLRELQAVGAKIVLVSHCGRPASRPDERYSLRPVAAELGRLMDINVAFAEDCVGAVAVRAVGALDLSGGEGGIDDVDTLVQLLLCHAQRGDEPDHVGVGSAVEDQQLVLPGELGEERERLGVGRVAPGDDQLDADHQPEPALV